MSPRPLSRQALQSTRLLLAAKGPFASYVLLVALLGCTSAVSVKSETTSPPPRPDPIAIQVARLESLRHAGTSALVEIAGKPELPGRLRAIRGLGRLGSPTASEWLQRRLKAPSISGHAAEALALASHAPSAAAIARRLPSANTTTKRSLLWSLARLGDADVVHFFVGALQSTNTAEAAAIGLGVLARRKVKWGPGTREALVKLASSPQLAYGVAYALAYEIEPPSEQSVLRALESLAQHKNPEVRALALRGLASRQAIGESHLRALDDPDWRVSVEAARALSGSSELDDRAALAGWIKSQVSRTTPIGYRLHAVATGMEALAIHDQDRKVQEMARAALGSPDRQLRCLAAATLQRAGLRKRDAEPCTKGAKGPWPSAEVDVLTWKLLASPDREVRGPWKDPRVKAAAIRALTPLQGINTAFMKDCLSDESAAVSGEALAALLAHSKAHPDARIAPDVAKLVRSSVRVDNVELRITALDTVAALQLDDEGACRASLGHSNRSVRAAAHSCVQALTGMDPEETSTPAPANIPPVRVEDVIGKRITWTVETTAGTMEIALEPDTAPWHVAVLVDLTRKKFYDGLSWHRVVPNFVIQGGDPDGTGWGGPGYTVPAEPSNLPFSRGVVGVADAGLDTGSSQWFVMHSRAPHLEGRYTRVGHVIRGQDVVDSIRVGDRILRATVALSTSQKLGQRSVSLPLVEPPRRQASRHPKAALVPRNRRIQVPENSCYRLVMSLLSALKGNGPSGFGYGSTAEEVTANIDLSGRTYVVTGCNSGIGKETMRVLALRGAHVIAAARTEDKAVAAARDVGAVVTPVACELSEPTSVQAAANAIGDSGRPLHGIVANAGIMAVPKRTVKHGLELQFLTNHMGHFILVTGLLDQLSDDARVVMLSSDAHKWTPRGGIQLGNLDAARGYHPWRHYGQSKLANLLFARQLARAFEGTGKTANAVHPGVIHTNLTRHSNPIVGAAMTVGGPLVLKTIAQGASTQCFVATHPSLKDTRGQYFADCNIARSSRHGRDLDLARRLWDVSEELRETLLANP